MSVGRGLQLQRRIGESARTAPGTAIIAVGSTSPRRSMRLQTGRPCFMRRCFSCVVALLRCSCLRRLRSCLRGNPYHCYLRVNVDLLRPRLEPLGSPVFDSRRLARSFSRGLRICSRLCLRGRRRDRSRWSGPHGERLALPGLLSDWHMCRTPDTLRCSTDHGHRQDDEHTE